MNESQSPKRFSVNKIPRKSLQGLQSTGKKSSLLASGLNIGAEKRAFDRRLSTVNPGKVIDALKSDIVAIEK